MALVVWSRVTGLHATVNACSNSSGVSMPSALWRLVRLWNSSRYSKSAFASSMRVLRYHLKLWIGFPDESAAYLPA